MILPVACIIIKGITLQCNKLERICNNIDALIKKTLSRSVFVWPKERSYFSVRLDKIPAGPNIETQ